MNSEKTFGFFSTPAGLDPMASYEETLAACNRHNESIARGYYDNLKRAEKQMLHYSIVVNKKSLSINEYESIKTKLLSTRNNFFSFIEIDIDLGVFINGEKNKAIKNTYNKLMEYYEKAINILDGYLVVTERKILEATPKPLIERYQLLPSIVIRQLHAAFNDSEKIWKRMDINDFTNCFDLNNTPTLKPKYNNQNLFVYLLSLINTENNGNTVNEKIALNNFGIRNYKQVKNYVKGVKIDGTFFSTFERNTHPNITARIKKIINNPVKLAVY